MRYGTGVILVDLELRRRAAEQVAGVLLRWRRRELDRDDAAVARAEAARRIDRAGAVDLSPAHDRAVGAGRLLDALHRPARGRRPGEPVDVTDPAGVQNLKLVGAVEVAEDDVRVRPRDVDQMQHALVVMCKDDAAVRDVPVPAERLVAALDLAAAPVRIRASVGVPGRLATAAALRLTAARVRVSVRVGPGRAVVAREVPLSTVTLPECLTGILSMESLRIQSAASLQL